MYQELLQQQLSHQEAPVQLPPHRVVEQKKKRLLSDKQLEAFRIGQEKRWKRMFEALEKVTGTAHVAVKGETDTNGEIQQFLNPNTLSSESSGCDSESTPPTPLPTPEPEPEPQIRKEKK